MGVSPIDLQTMYANMNNVARLASHQQQGVVLAQQLQESKIIQQNAEKAAQVHKAADNDAKSTGIHDDAQGGAELGGTKNARKRRTARTNLRQRMSLKSVSPISEDT